MVWQIKLPFPRRIGRVPGEKKGDGGVGSCGRVPEGKKGVSGGGGVGVGGGGGGDVGGGNFGRAVVGRECR